MQPQTDVSGPSSPHVEVFPQRSVTADNTRWKQRICSKTIQKKTLTLGISKTLAELGFFKNLPARNITQDAIEFHNLLLLHGKIVGRRTRRRIVQVGKALRKYGTLNYKR
jgi:hypothetical protein